MSWSFIKLKLILLPGYSVAIYRADTPLQYPSQQSTYPPQMMMHPSQQNMYPAQTMMYPSQMMMYPQQGPQGERNPQLQIGWNKATERNRDTHDHQSNANHVEVVDTEQSGINPTNYSYLRCNVLLKGVKCEAIVDTGANVVIVSSVAARKAKIIVQWQSDLQIKTASGQDAKIMGIAYKVPITISGITKHFDALIMNTNTYEVLLGTNALQEFGAIIDFTQQQLFLTSPVGRVQVPTSFIAGEQPIARFALTKTITIPPMSM